jgi:hypothetical protein
MSDGPVGVLDGLIRGVILVTYDFARLTALGLMLPFLRRTRRVWPLLRAIDKRFSSLTYLVIWILIVVASFSGTASNIVLSYVGLEKNPSAEVPALIAAVLLITMLSDLLVRAGASMIRDRARRTLYEPLARLAIANIFVGMLVVIAAAEFTVYRNPSPFSFFWSPLFVFLGLASFHGEFSYPYLPFFGISLAIVLTRAFAIRPWKRRALIGLPIALFAPALLVSATVWLYLAVANAAFWLAPAKAPSLSQQFVSCSYKSGSIHASGLLKLEALDAVAINANLFAILLGHSGADNPAVSSALIFAKDRYLGRGDEGQPPIVLSGGRFIPVDLMATFAPVAGSSVAAPPEGGFGCELGLLDMLGDRSEPVIYGQPPDSFSPPGAP